MTNNGNLLQRVFICVVWCLRRLVLRLFWLAGHGHDFSVFVGVQKIFDSLFMLLQVQLTVINSTKMDFEITPISFRL